MTVTPILVAILLVSGQTMPHTAAKTPNMSADFSKAGLRALLAIEGTAAQPRIVNGQLAFPSDVVKMLNDANVEAQTDVELEAYKTLQAFLMIKMTGNSKRVIANGTDPEADKLDAACSSALEPMFRSHIFTPTTACGSLD